MFAWFCLFIIIVLHLFLDCLSYHVLCSFFSLRMFLSCYAVFSTSSFHSLLCFTALVHRRLLASAVSFCLFHIHFHYRALVGGARRFLQKLNGPNKRKNLALRNEPTPFFPKSKKSGQRTFPCILLLLPSIAAGLRWN